MWDVKFGTGRLRSACSAQKGGLSTPRKITVSLCLISVGLITKVVAVPAVIRDLDSMRECVSWRKLTFMTFKMKGARFGTGIGGNA